MADIKEKNPESQWFGYEQVSPEDKTRRVEGVFDSVASNYDLMNDLMSGGVHRLWKNHLVRKIRPRPDQDYLDVAGGTGDIAFRIRKKRGSGPKTGSNISPITVCDLNPSMLEVGENRAIDRGYIHDFRWVVGNAERLPFEDARYDVYTIAFGLRNVTHIDNALADAYRVLRPGGRFYCLEFSAVDDSVIAPLYDRFSFKIIPKIGRYVAKDEQSYQYLVESIRQFPSQPELASRMKKAGFECVTYENLSFGIAAIHSGVKI